MSRRPLVNRAVSLALVITITASGALPVRPCCCSSTLDAETTSPAPQSCCAREPERDVPPTHRSGQCRCNHGESLAIRGTGADLPSVDAVTNGRVELADDVVFEGDHVRPSRPPRHGPPDLWLRHCAPLT